MTPSKWVSLFAVPALVACAKDVPKEAPVVLDVAGRQVLLEELERFVQSSVRRESPVLSSEVMAALFEEFVEEQLLLQRAEEAGVEVGREEVRSRVSALRSASGESDLPLESLPMTEEALEENVERQLRIERLLEDEVLSRIAVEESEVGAHYEANRDDYVRPETVDVSQILVDTAEEAEEIRRALGARKSTFEELARELSQGPEAERGGHLGAFARGELPPSFEEAVFALKPGAISSVVATDFGFHLFRLNGRTTPEPLALDDVREMIRIELLRRKSDEAMERYLDELEKRYPVTVHHEHLSFAVVGRAGSLGNDDGEKVR
jgi:parvulin-like peptidyl-prolyl isomerase